MGMYGKAAVRAVSIMKENQPVDPLQAWKTAVRELFPDSKSSQDKGCPRGAFLGLCEAGIVRGVKPGSYTRSVKNKRYAVEAIEILRQSPNLAENKGALWSRVMAGEEKKENSQMDVVISLWNSRAF